MSNLAMQVKTNDKIYTVEFESVAYPYKDFTVFIPGKYKIVEKENCINSFDTEAFSNFYDEVFKISKHGSLDFGFDLNGIPLELTTYDAITKFINVLIGSQYCAILGKDYIDNIKSLYNPVFKDLRLIDVNSTDVENNREKFNDVIEKLNSFTVDLINKCTSIINCKSNDNFRDLKVKQNEVSIKDINNLSTSDDLIIRYDETPTIYESLLQIGFLKNSDDIIVSLLNQLAKASELSMWLDENSYRRFIGSMMEHMYCNPNIVNYNSTIMNYSIFKWSIPGYPYCTNSNSVYSIRESKSNNKIVSIMNRINNIDSFIKAMLDIKNKRKEDTYAAEDVLKDALSVLCICLGLKAEMIAIEKLESGQFVDRIIERNPLRTSKRFIR